MNHQETYKDRNKGINQAELYAVEYYNSRGIIIIRSGLDAMDKKIPAGLWCNIPESIRNIPDYIIMSKKGNYFLECKGGKSHIHLKVGDMRNYKFWDEYMPVIMFIWSSTYNTIYRVEYYRLMDLIDEMAYSIGEYENNGKQYYKIPMKDLSLVGGMDAQPGYYLNDWNQVLKEKE